MIPFFAFFVFFQDFFSKVLSLFQKNSKINKFEQFFAGCFFVKNKISNRLICGFSEFSGQSRFFSYTF